MTSGSRAVVVAPTGSGKTTQAPQMLLDAGLAGKGRIVVLQPRRVAARTVAARVAWERNSPLGAEVGYQIRFDDRTGLGTRICFVTEGILLRWLQDDPLLRDVGILVFDEFHERNLLSDVALALARDLQRKRRPDLKLLVMSATLDAEPVSDYLDACPVLVSEGQAFPVDVRYLDYRDERPPSEQAASVIENIIYSGADGDILVFMPGMGEIQGTINAVRAARMGERLALIPLHGDLAPEDQDRAFQPSDCRKVVVATNVAETSVTIDGIRHVVDSGLARVSRYDPERGISSLLIEDISRASADQRKGRAGRTAPGACHRLWTESGHLNRPERNTPEIQRSDLAEVVLLLHSLGIRKAAEFDWLDRPDPLAVQRAEKLLVTLGALAPQSDAPVPASDEPARSDLTPVGRQMLRLPMHPRYSRMIVEAVSRGCVPAATLCAALVSGRDILMRIGREDKHIAEARELFEGSQDSDFHTLMRAWQFARRNQFATEACRRYGIHAQTARLVAQTYEQLLALVDKAGLAGLPKASGDADTPPASADDTGLRRSLMAGFIDQLCVRRDLGTLECEMTEGRQGTLMRESVVQQSRLFVAAAIREVAGRGSGNLTLLGLATAIEPAWLAEMFPQHLTHTVEHLFDTMNKRVAAVRLTRFQDLVIAHEHQRELNPVASGLCLARAFRAERFELPLFNHEIKQFIARVNLAAAVMPEMEIPIIDDDAVVACLGRGLSGLSLVREAQGQNLREGFHAHLAREQLGWLDELVPSAVPWLAGKTLKLLYPEEARDKAGRPQPPEAQVKLHECFPVREHPVLCEGKLPVLLWLCGPDGKRIESTTDWPRFKVTRYPALRSALLKKYPGVPWI
jgi:ATP-dependent helicase HrpB